MDVGERNNWKNVNFNRPPAKVLENSKHELRRTQKRLMTPASYFSLESLVLMVGLTASMLILPLVLPPLPPPPFMLLLIPIEARYISSLRQHQFPFHHASHLVSSPPDQLAVDSETTSTYL
ncbi:hypothetical protein YC2023_111066 [Brassica napus]